MAALLVLAGASATVRADTITIAGVDSGQFSTATVVCEFNSANQYIHLYNHEYLAYHATRIDIDDHRDRL